MLKWPYTLYLGQPNSTILAGSVDIYDQIRGSVRPAKGTHHMFKTLVNFDVSKGFHSLTASRDLEESTLKITGSTLKDLF